MKIGFFDSGLGGLAILKAVTLDLPDFDYLYYGDTKNLPLGDKTEAEIFEYTKAGVRYLFEHDCMLVIIACNTASAETLRKLQDTFLFEEYPERRILGVIIPTIECLIETKSKHAVLLATCRTVASGKYEIELQKQAIIHPHLTSVATPELVPLLETGNIDEALRVAKSVVGKVSTEAGEVDAVIFGCTHYVLLKNKLREAYREQIAIISQDEIIPMKLKLYLDKHTEIKTKLTHGGTRNIFFTEHRGEYDVFASELLNGRFIKEQ